MQSVGKFMDQVFVDNPTTTRLFSLDELESKKINSVFQHTGHNFQ